MLVEMLVCYRNENKNCLEKKMDLLVQKYSNIFVMRHCLFTYFSPSMLCVWLRTSYGTMPILTCVICVIKLAGNAIDSSKVYVTINMYHLCSRNKVVVR
jgi:hypothetical protein